jgi:glutamyl-tRNA reductase
VLFEAKAIALSQLPQRLHDADIVISSTASTLPILGKGTVEWALKERRHKPIFMVDLAVPRDIEPQVGELADIYLYSIDDLRSVVEENLETRKAAAHDAEKIIESQTRDFMRWLQGLNAVPTIRDLHQHIETISNEELEKATRRLKAGDDPEQVMKSLARSISRKFSHKPLEGLNRDDSGQLADAARRLFGLETDDA